MFSVRWPLLSRPALCSSIVLLSAYQNYLAAGADPLSLVSVLCPVARRVSHWTLSVSPGCC